MVDVVLVDSSDEEIGFSPSLTAHEQGLLHRAVSVFVFNRNGELLIQKRAGAKAAFAGKWANTCCTHARSGESLIETGERRLREELGMEVALSHVGSFLYKAHDPESGLTEHELDHVLVGVSGSEPQSNPAEVQSTDWVDPESLLAGVEGPEYAPWLGQALRLVVRQRPDILAGEGLSRDERDGGGRDQ